MVDPSSGGHVDGEQQEGWLEAWDEEGGHDDDVEQARRGQRPKGALGG